MDVSLSKGQHGSVQYYCVLRERPIRADIGEGAMKEKAGDHFTHREDLSTVNGSFAGYSRRC